MIGQHQNVAAVGVECEGFWKRNNGHPIHGDGSVQILNIKERRAVPAANTWANQALAVIGRRATPRVPTTIGYHGEKSSPVFRALNDLQNWLYNEYPNRRNRSCGFHINVSLINPSILRTCATREIHDAMIKALVGYGKKQRLGRAFEERLKPDAEYSRLAYDRQSKYRAINWSKISNPGAPYVEFRLFSQVMPKEKAMNAVKFCAGLLDFVAELVKNPEYMPSEVRLKKIENYRID